MALIMTTRRREEGEGTNHAQFAYRGKISSDAAEGVEEWNIAALIGKRLICSVVSHHDAILHDLQTFHGRLPVIPLVTASVAPPPGGPGDSNHAGAPTAFMVGEKALLGRRCARGGATEDDTAPAKMAAAATTTDSARAGGERGVQHRRKGIGAAPMRGRIGGRLGGMRVGVVGRLDRASSFFSFVLVREREERWKG